MKKLIFILIIIFTTISCIKIDSDNEYNNCNNCNNHNKKNMNAINTSFTAKDGDITFKAAPTNPITVERTWTLLAKNSSLYSSAFALVDGREDNVPDRQIQLEIGNRGEWFWDGEIYDYFYTESELRQIKLERLNNV